MWEILLRKSHYFSNDYIKSVILPFRMNLIRNIDRQIGFHAAWISLDRMFWLHFYRKSFWFYGKSAAFFDITFINLHQICYSYKNIIAMVDSLFGFDEKYFHSFCCVFNLWCNCIQWILVIVSILRLMTNLLSVS